MRITEIVGSYADREEPEMAWDSSLLRTVANAFTRTGKVKGPLDQQLADGRPIAAHLPFSSQAASDEDPTADATSNTGTDAPMIPTTQILHRSAIRRIGAAPHWPESSFYRSSSFGLKSDARRSLLQGAMIVGVPGKTESASSTSKSTTAHAPQRWGA